MIAFRVDWALTAQVMELRMSLDRVTQELTAQSDQRFKAPQVCLCM